MPVDWVVVGLDNGGTMNNGTALDAGGRFLLDQLAEVPSEVGRARTRRSSPGRLRASRCFAHRRPVTAVKAVGLDTRVRPRGWRHLVQGRHELRSRRLARLRHPRRAGRTARSPGDLQQRRELGRAVRPPRAVRRGVRAAEFGGRDRGTGLGGGIVQTGHVIKGAAGMAGELGHVPIPLDDLLAREADADLQLRSGGRRGERGLAHRDPEQPAAVLADQVPGS